MTIDRRAMIASLLTAFPAVAMVREARAFARTGTTLKRWSELQRDLADALMKDRISGPQWAAGVRALAAEIDVAEVHRGLARAQVSKPVPNPLNDPPKRIVRFLDGQGKLRRLGYGAALFEFAPHNVITPHGHRHMASAHMIVKGKFRVRNFNRLGEDETRLLVRPSRDEVMELGSVSTMCDEEDNVHWFVPQGGPATTFDVIISGLDEGKPPYRIIAIDPLNAQPAGKGRLFMPKIDFAEASKRYTTRV